MNVQYKWKMIKTKVPVLFFELPTQDKQTKITEKNLSPIIVLVMYFFFLQCVNSLHFITY